MNIQNKLNRIFAEDQAPEHLFYPIANLRKDLNCYSDSDFIDLCLQKNPALSSWLPFYAKMGYFKLSSRYLHNPLRHILSTAHGARVTTIYIPKNACTMVKKILLLLSGEDLSQVYPGRFHPMAESRFKASIHEISDCSIPRFQFILLRCPIERFWSAFIDKFISKPEAPIVKSFLNNLNITYTEENLYEVAGNVRIEDIVDLICWSPDNSLDKHFCSQSAFFTDELSEKFDLIKVKSLTRLSRAIELATNIALDVSDSPHKTSYSGSLPSFDSLFVNGTVKDVAEFKAAHGALPSSSQIAKYVQKRFSTRFSHDFHYYDRAIAL